MDTVARVERSVVSADEVLVVRAASGDVPAFDALVATRLDRCHRLAWSILGNEADAADVVQEAVVAAWRTLPRLREPAAFDGWLNRIVRNTALMSIRHRKRLREVPYVATPEDPEVDAAEEVPPTRHTESDAVIERDAMARAFGRLEPAQRAILVLHHVDGRPVAEIARTLGIATGTVKSRLFAARRALAHAMEGEA